MQEPEPLRSARRSDAAGARRPAEPVEPPAVPGNDPPTIRSGGSGSGSSQRRFATATLPEPGDRIDCFELQEAIGVGGMGAVFRALDTRLDRIVAVKVLPPDQAGDAETVQRFYQEGKAAARLDHENIARVFTIGHDKSLHFIAFEFIEGTTIRQRVDQHGTLPVAEAINFTLQIAGALVHASERGVVHRDIKPSNIIVTPQGRAKLVDMGLARRFERGGQDDGLTQSGMTLGTFDYISPEQARDPRDVDVRSDLYSLGCTLFHMLTGQPPFPGGTVLQKLLQHQEEPPPEIRALNPEVPPDLAAILAKLMAKDRDRRYQTPEQLVRDLLTVAGALGLRSLSPEGLVWMTATPPPSWERHLFWGIPALALALVVVGLVWWGQEPEPAAGQFTPGPVPVVFPQAAAPVAAEPAPAGPSGAANPARRPGRADPAATSPRRIEVKAGDDLMALMASAPAGSTLVLVDAGPFDLVPEPSGAPLLARLDLTIEAGPRARPVLRCADGAEAQELDAPLLRFVGGRVTLDGLTFAPGPGPDGREPPSAALRVEGTDLTLRGCLFRSLGLPGEPGRGVALEVRASADDGERPPLVGVDACHFDGGQVGVYARGPAEIRLGDCTFGGAEPAIWFDNPGETAVAARLWLSHVSILAGDGPVFQFSGTAAQVRVDDSVVAPAAGGQVILIAADDPDRIVWVGRDNLYARIASYMQPAQAPQDEPAIGDFTAWTDAPDGPRESGSIAREDNVWEEDDPRPLTRDDLARAFRLGPERRPSPASGARRGPLGPIVAPSEALALGTPPPKDQPRLGPNDDPARPGGAPNAQDPNPSGPDDVLEPMAVASAPMVRKEEGPTMPPAPAPPDGPEDTGGDAGDGRPPEPDPDRPRPRAPGAGIAQPAAAPLPDAAPAPLRTRQQFLDAWQRLGPADGMIRLAAGADLVLPTCELSGSGRRAIEAEPGLNRPRLRFEPGREATASWPALFQIRKGSLHLRDVDIVLNAADAPDEMGRWAAFGLWAGAGLSLSGCTVTVEGRARSVLVAVQVAEDQAEPGLVGADPSAATVRVTESLLRGGGDLVDVSAGRRLDLDLDHVVISTGGSLVHGHGLPRGQIPEPLKVSLRHVTTRNAGGLVQLESAAGEPDLPVAEVFARDTILATSPQGGPLFRIDGQDALDGLRDRILWDGHGVAYHQIDTYRLDQIAQPGTVPVRFDRPSWEIAIGTREDAPIHGDLKFLKDWDPDRPHWTLTKDDVRLAPESPAPSSSGPDLQRIPDPPPA